MKNWMIAFAAAFSLTLAAEDIGIANATARTSFGTTEITQNADGKGVIVLKGVPKTEKVPENHYLLNLITLPQPIDMTNKVLRFKISSTAADNMTGFFIRGYNKGVSGKYPLAWSIDSPSWTVCNSPRTVTLVPYHDQGIVRWRKNQVNNAAPTEIDRLQIFVLTKDNTRESDIKLEDFEVEESFMGGLQQVFAPLGNVKTFGVSNYCKSPIIKVAEEDGAQVLTITGKGPANSTSNNQFEAIQLYLDTPVSVQNRTISLSIQRQEHVNLFFFRGYNSDNTGKKFDFSYALHCPMVAPDTWTPVTLGKAPSRVDSKYITGNAPDKINRIEIIFSTPKPDQEFTLKLKDFKVSDPVQ